MGFWSTLRDFVTHPIETLRGGESPPPEVDDFETEFSPGGTGNEGEFDWQLAGYVPAGQVFDGGYVNVDPDSSGDRVVTTSFTGWDFLPDTDYVVVKVFHGGESYYVTLGGPFEDIEDLESAIADWWEVGS